MGSDISLQRLILAGSVGFGVGFATGWWTVPTEPSAGTPQGQPAFLGDPMKRTVSERPYSATADCVPCSNQEELEARLDRVGQAMEAQRSSVVGEAPAIPPSAWPDYLPDVVEDRLPEIIDRCSGIDSASLLIDCEEFPCLVFQLAPTASPPLRDCPEWPYESSHAGITLRDNAQIAWTAVAPTGWYDPAEGSDFIKRLTYRVELGIEMIDEQHDEAEAQ